MYTLEELSGKIIWYFREPRSGSIWVKNNLKNLLKREMRIFDFPRNEGFQRQQFNDERLENNKTLLKESEDPNQRHNHLVMNYFNDRNQQLDDVDYLLDSHHFEPLVTMKKYTNPILLRTSRKNKTEQFLSSYIAKNTGIHQLYTQTEIDSYPKINPIIVPLDKTIYRYIRYTIRIETWWNEYASQHENETIYYEDILSGWESKILPLKLNMSEMNNIEELPMKLPYDKREIILNYDEVDKLLKQELNNVFP